MWSLISKRNSGGPKSRQHAYHMQHMRNVTNSRLDQKVDFRVFLLVPDPSLIEHDFWMRSWSIDDFSIKNNDYFNWWNSILINFKIVSCYFRKISTFSLNQIIWVTRVSWFLMNLNSFLGRKFWFNTFDLIFEVNKHEISWWKY